MLEVLSQSLYLPREYRGMLDVTVYLLHSANANQALTKL